MPYPPGHRDEVKERIVSSARRLFNRHGFEQVSLNQIMAGAGLTRGGFYTYFGSKSDLYVEVLGCFFTDPDWKNSWEGVEVDLNSSNAGGQVVSAYLSQQHFENVENSCPMIALPTDVTRSGQKARIAFEAVFSAMVSVLERSMRGKRRDRHIVAQATAALCVGGMVVARAIDNRAAADSLRDACRLVAFQLGGWRGSKASNSKTNPNLRRPKRKSTSPIRSSTPNRRRRS